MLEAVRTSIAAPPLRVGFVMEQVLGHISHYDTLRRVYDNDQSVDPRWIEVTYRADGLLERLSALPEGVRGTLRGYTQVRQGVRGEQFNALFFHTQKPAVFQWDLLARTPTVLSLDVTPKQYDELGEFYDHAPDRGGSVAARFKHWMNVRTFALSKGIVVWSRWVKDSLVADYEVAPEKVQVIPPGVDLSLWTFQASPRAELPRLLFVGGDFERKGGPLLLDWFRQHGRGRCALDIVTRAPVEAEPGVTVHRNIVGNSADARNLFAQADIFVLPTVGECFGIASVEAMAAQLPVVTTRVGGAADIVDHGETGFLIEPHSPRQLAAALDALLDDPSLRTRMAAAGRAKAERHFDAATNARAILSLLRGVAA